MKILDLQHDITSIYSKINIEVMHVNFKLMSGNYETKDETKCDYSIQNLYASYITLNATIMKQNKSI